MRHFAEINRGIQTSNGSNGVILYRRVFGNEKCGTENTTNHIVNNTKQKLFTLHSVAKMHIKAESDEIFKFASHMESTHFHKERKRRWNKQNY